MKISAFKKSYEGKWVLDFPGFELKDGNICAVIGSNGSGKSTIAKVLAGIVKADNRRLPVPNDISVGYMPQKSFAFRLSTISNIRLSGGSEEEALVLMKRLQIDHLARKRAKKMSGGETARMALARLLIRPYDLLILDEPTASMDIESTALTEEVVSEYCRNTGCTVLWVTHSLQQARRVAQQAIFMRNGCLCEAGEAEKLLFNPDKTETREFLEFYGI
ncbi:MAG: ATP-binding cassette domain-containing protein [Oscillospiraceae bacterium]|nr:ATP-binding cassette domain-containing protein [Oscillospiraceae bacterium]